MLYDAYDEGLWAVPALCRESDSTVYSLCCFQFIIDASDNRYSPRKRKDQALTASISSCMLVSLCVLADAKSEKKGAVVTKANGTSDVIASPGPSVTQWFGLE